MTSPRVQSVPLDKAAVRRAATAHVMRSITPEDWIALETLAPRLKNELLRQAVSLLLRRKRVRP
jgi:hypothetical protein